MIQIGDAIDIYRRNAAILEQVRSTYPYSEILVLPSLHTGHLSIATVAVNSLVDHVDIVGSQAYPYVVFPVQNGAHIKKIAVQSWPHIFHMETDEGYEVDWDEDMRKAGIPEKLIEHVRTLRTQDVRCHRDANVAGNFTLFY